MSVGLHDELYSFNNARVKIGDYVMGKTLGVGSFGKVKLAEHVHSQQLVAIKILNRKKIERLGLYEKVRREVRILQKCVHPHIIRLYEVIETPTDVFVVMEYGANGELFDYIVSRGRLPEDEARKYFQHIVSGVAFCHANNIVHRDLKPENLLLTADYKVKVGDFGLSNILNDGDFLKTSCGSPNYAAPEVISGQLYAGPEIDVWSCGVILYALLCGALPFDDETIPKLFKKIKNGIYHLPSHLSTLAQDLIPRMLEKEPMKRITMDGIRDHPWFKIRLPMYLSVNILEQRNEQKEIDEGIVDDIVIKMSDIPFVKECGRKGVLLAIGCAKMNDVKTMYMLLSDRKLDYIRNESEESLNREREAKRNRIINENAPVKNVEKKTGKNAYTDDTTLNQNHVIAEPTSPRSAAMQKFAQKATKDADDLNASSNSTKTENDALVPSVFSPTKIQLAPSNPFLHKRSQQPEGLSDQRKRINLEYQKAKKAPTSTQVVLKLQNIKRRKWYLGIQSKKDPELVMNEIFKVLFRLNCEWHYTDDKPYKVYCRWRPSSDSDEGETDSTWIYTKLQLYKVQTSIYLLDFQRCEGFCKNFEFIYLCGLIIKSLKPPSAATVQNKR